MSFGTSDSLYGLPCLSGGVFPDNIPFEELSSLVGEGSKVRELLVFLDMITKEFKFTKFVSSLLTINRR